MTKRLDILVNLIKQGNGGKLAKDDLQGVELSAKEAEISVKALDTKYRELVREVAKGNRTVDDARREYRDFARELGVVERQSSDTQLNIITLNQALELGQKAFNGVHQAAELTFETLQEGERLTALRNTFDNLAGSLGNTDDLLNRLQTSTSGAVNQTILMEAANKALNLRLATTDDELVKLVGNAAALGANLGDVGGTIDNVLAAIANESKLRLDNFGVAASRVEELQEQLQAAGEEGTFAQAVMIALEETVDRTGARANLAADDMGRLRSALEDAKNEALVELISAFGEDLPSAIDEGVAAVKEFSDAFDSDDIRKTIDFLETLWKFTAPGMAQALRDAIPEVEATANEFERMPPHVAAAKREMLEAEAAANRLERANRELITGRGAIPAVTEATDDQVEANQRLIRSTEGLTEEQIAQNLHMLRTLGVARQFTRTMNEMGDDYELLEPPVRSANRAIEETGDVAEDTALAVTSYTDAINEQAAAARAVRDAEQARISSLNDYATSVQLAADNTFNANDAIFRHIDALNASPEVTLAAGLALGIYSEAQVRARLEAVKLEAELRSIESAVLDGRLSAEEGVAAYLGLANGTYESAAAAIIANDAFLQTSTALDTAEASATDLATTFVEANDAADALALGFAATALEAQNAAIAAEFFRTTIDQIPNNTIKKLTFVVEGGQVTAVGNVNAPAVISQYSGGPAEAGQPYLVGDGPGGSFIPGATELFIPGQSGYVVSNRQVEQALRTINHNNQRTYTDRSSTRIYGVDPRNIGRKLTTAKRRQFNRMYR